MPYNKIRYYLSVYGNCPDPRRVGSLWFIRAASFTTLKGSVGLTLGKVLARDLRVSIPIDLSSHPFILGPSRFPRSQHPPTILQDPSLVTVLPLSRRTSIRLIVFIYTKQRLFGFRKTLHLKGCMCLLPLEESLDFISV